MRSTTSVFNFSAKSENVRNCLAQVAPIWALNRGRKYRGSRACQHRVLLVCKIQAEATPPRLDRLLKRLFAFQRGKRSSPLANSRILSGQPAWGLPWAAANRA
jgi:hypothetical protein